MKYLLILLLLATPVAASHTPPSTPEVDAELDLQDYLDHGAITQYGYPDKIGGWSMQGSQGRLIVPGESLAYFRFPYNNFATTW
jgi:hypothetical protein